MVGRGEITDEAWGRIAPLLPEGGPRGGGRRKDHRRVLNGIPWKLRTGGGALARPARALRTLAGTCYATAS